MKFLTWQNPEQLFVAQELINKVKSKCCGIKVVEKESVSPLKEGIQQQIEYVPEHNKETEKVPAFLSNIGEAVGSVANDSGWSQLGDVGNLLVKKDPAFDTRNFGFKKLSSLIEAYPSYFDLRKGE